MLASSKGNPVTASVKKISNDRGYALLIDAGYYLLPYSYVYYDF